MKNLKQSVIAAVACLAGLTAQAQSVSVTDATITWAFNAGTSSPTTATVSADGLVSSSSYTLGSKYTIGKDDGTYQTGTTSDSKTLNLLYPTEKIGNAVDNAAYVTFSIIPKKGLTFTPKSVNFNAAKNGTSGGTLEAHAVVGTTDVTLEKAFNPERLKSYTNKTIDLTSVGEVSERMDLVFYIYNLNTGKSFALGDIVVTGDFSGTPEEVASYTMTVTSANAAAGTATANPAGDSFDAGTEITVTATENFGYHFAGWQDADGNTVSTENPYKFAIAANTTLTATYTQNNVYALNLKLEGGANTNLVQYAPAGNVVNGVHYYEEGTEVRLTALNNRILTFTHWNDNSTASTLDLKMDEQKDITATFAAEDYIVGWDLYNDDPKSERAADYKAESDNAGLLSLRNAAGNTSSWLSRGVSNGQENGKYAARIWKNLTDEYYFEISFSSKEYSNLKLAAAVGDDYNTYSVNNVQYSTDGENYTTFGTYNPPARGWDSEEFDLPEAANNQDRVWIRFMPDRTSDLIGVSSAYDGTSVAEIFVLGDRDASSDEEPPVLVAAIPANNAVGASASGSIVLTFDEKIKVGTDEGKATLNGKSLAPTLSGKTAVYPYSGLNYATQYDFTLPAGAITDRNGNSYAGTTISFTTMERKQSEARVFDAVVAADGTGDYTTVQAAIDAAPTSRVKPWLIFIKNGTYNEHVDLPATKPFLHFIGQDRNKVIITDNRRSGGEGEGTIYSADQGATFIARANDLYFEGINFVNSWGVEQNNGPQALALNTAGDRITFNKCGMRSYQDTWITTNKSAYRCYSKDCFIEGAVDFIYNGGDYFFDHDTLYITRKSGGFIVAPAHDSDTKWGYVFRDNVITAPGVPSETSIWLGRPWHKFPKTVFINTKAEVTIPATGWYETMGGLPVIWADYGTVDGDGNLVDLSQRRDTYYYTDSETGEKVYGTAKNSLTDEEAASYTIENVLRGDDAWMPELLVEACEAPAPVINKEKNTISWTAVPYAICYVITKDGEFAGFTTATSMEYAEGSDYAIQAANEYGGLSPMAKAVVADPTAIQTAEQNNNGTVVAVYSIDGKLQHTQSKGLSIVKMQTSEGNVVARKFVK